MSEIANKANISKPLLNDVILTVRIYSLNNKSARFYAFNARDDGKEISNGEFMYAGEDTNQYSYILDLQTGELMRNPVLT